MAIKLAILDDYANIAAAHFKNSRDLEIHSFPETLNARLPVEHDALIARLHPFTIISSMRERTQFPRSVLSQLPNLKLILTTGGRNAAIDVVACHELGIKVVGTGPKPNAVPGYDSTNEQTWALILGLVKDVVAGDTRLKGTRKGWQRDLAELTDDDNDDDDEGEAGPDVDDDDDDPEGETEALTTEEPEVTGDIELDEPTTATTTGNVGSEVISSHPESQHNTDNIDNNTNTGNLKNTDAVNNDANARFNPSLVSSLAGKTLGLLGLGRLGTQAAVTGRLGFGMKILAWSSSLTPEKADAAAVSRGLPPGSFEVAGSKDDLFRRADILSIHYVLSERSRGIVGKRELALMKPTAYLVNTSRGPLIAEPDLLEVLEKGGIRGVGLDVFDTEPLPEASPFRRKNFWGRKGRSRVLVSPHLGYADEETMHAWYAQQADVVRKWIDGDEVTEYVIA